jgi:hypothetical protein
MVDPSEGTRGIDLNNPPPDNGDDYFETQEETVAAAAVRQEGVSLEATTDSTQPTFEIGITTRDLISILDSRSIENVTFFC